MKQDATKLEQSQHLHELLLSTQKGFIRLNVSSFEETQMRSASGTAYNRKSIVGVALCASWIVQQVLSNCRVALGLLSGRMRCSFASTGGLCALNGSTVSDGRGDMLFNAISQPQGSTAHVPGITPALKLVNNITQVGGGKYILGG